MIRQAIINVMIAPATLCALIALIGLQLKSSILPLTFSIDRGLFGSKLDTSIKSTNHLMIMTIHQQIVHSSWPIILKGQNNLVTQQILMPLGQFSSIKTNIHTWRLRHLMEWLQRMCKYSNWVTQRLLNNGRSFWINKIRFVVQKSLF